LSNIRSAAHNSPDRLPTTFNGLAQILLKQNLDFIKKKTWYCNNKNCLKSFEKIVYKENVKNVKQGKNQFLRKK